MTKQTIIRIMSKDGRKQKIERIEKRKGKTRLNQKKRRTFTQFHVQRKGIPLLFVVSNFLLHSEHRIRMDLSAKRIGYWLTLPRTHTKQIFNLVAFAVSLNASQYICSQSEWNFCLLPIPFSVKTKTICQK